MTSGRAESAVNKNAPVVAEGEIEIKASPELIWQLITDIEAWPTWNPDVRSAKIAGAVAPGTQFSWKAGPGLIRSTFRAVESPRLLAWTGRTMGIRAVHVWELLPSEGTTRLRTEESWEGLIASTFKGRMRKALQKAIDGGLRHTKREAERRAGC